MSIDELNTAFWALIALDGEAYDRARADYSRGANPATLAALAASGDPRARTQAKIILGWKAHGDAYRELLAMLDAEDVDRESRMMAGVAGIWKRYARLAQTRHRETVLPLCWEVMHKHASDWPSFKVIAFLWMMQVVPHEDSLDPLLECLRTTDDDALAASAVVALATLPRPLVAPRLAAAMKKNARVKERLGEVDYRVNRPPNDED